MRIVIRCVFTLSVLGWGACSQGSLSDPTVLGARASTPAPLDHGTLCLDVGTARACWLEAGGSAREPNDESPGRADCIGGTCAVPRPSPEGVPDALFRCAGQGKARTCEPRSEQAGAFEREQGRWVQKLPRSPDSGEWLCVEMQGVVYCKSVVSAAGVVPGPRDPAFVCGPRHGAAAETICVDFAPDPPPALSDFDCRFDYSSGTGERACVVSKEPRVGKACSHGQKSGFLATPSAACPEGAACVGGYCLPARPVPACWLDQDCEHAEVCRWGSCVTGAGSP